MAESRTQSMNLPGRNRRRLQYSIGCLLLVITVSALPLAACSYVLKLRKEWLAEVERRAKQDPLTLKQVVIVVESLCKELGRAAKDQGELESLMGKPLPKVHDEGYPTPINYWRTGESSFKLQYELWATDDWIYDSTKPDAGWVQHFY